MNNLIVKGIVVSSVDYNESDKILTILTFEKGKITVNAKGVRKKSSKLSHIARVLYCGVFDIVNTHNRFILVGATTLIKISEISNDMESFYFAAHYVDIASSIIMEDLPDEQIIKLLLNTLFILSKKKIDIKLLTSIYELRIVLINGLAPYMEGCVECGNTNEVLKFSFSEGGLVCCKEGINISKTCIKAINYIMTCDENQLYKFKVSKSVIEELSYISRKYIENVFERKFEKADGYNLDILRR